MIQKTIDIPVEKVILKGNVTIPDNPLGLIIFSHGSGSSRLSPRNRFVAEELNRTGFSTLLFDLLTPEEDMDYEQRFDIDLLTVRLRSVTERIMKRRTIDTAGGIGLFGSSTGAASALKAAADLGPEIVKAVVSRGGRPDLAFDALERVKSPTLLIVGGRDHQVIELNEKAFEKLDCTKEIRIISGATHLFEEPGKLELVTYHASEWFFAYMGPNANITPEASEQANRLRL